jgi:hypothetical protein
LLRRRGRRGFRRLVFLSALVGILLVAPSAGGVPGDSTPPVITPIFTRGTAGANGWYTTDVRVRWQVEDPESPDFTTSGCDTEDVTIEPGGWIDCTAESSGGRRKEERLIRLDKTAAVVSAVLERQPDANGWYNRPFTVTFTGTDATSGIQSCTSVRYGGPDNAAAAVAGSCIDVAGNVTNASHSFKYDATAPTVFAVTKKPGNRSAKVAWRKSTDTQLVEVMRAPGRNGQGESAVYRGSEAGFRDTGLVVGRKYVYRVIGVDEAANRAEQKVDLVATGALLSPTPAERVSSPPNLVWTAVKRASYYNVQLIRGRKVLSAWPAHPGFQLRRTWTYNGRRYRLRPGVYRWYVWPGRGRRSAARFGRLLGSSTFVVTR